MSIEPVAPHGAGYFHDALNLNQIAGLSDTAKFPKQQIAAALQQTYGRRLADEVLEKCDALREQITGSEVKQLLVAVAALVKRQDLQETFEEILRLPAAGRGCMQWLSSKQIERIRSKSSFEELGNEELISLRNLYCRIHDGKGGFKPIAEELFPQTQVSRETTFGRHLKMVRASEMFERYVQNPEGDHFELRQQMAGEEHLARTLSYNLPNQDSMNLIVPILNEQGETILCEVRGVVEERGLYFFVFQPLSKGQWHQSGQNQPDSPCPIWYVFRGTNDLDAWKRNLLEGTIEAGRYSYARHEPKILRCFLSCLPQGPFKLAGTGHSLGGAEAARMARTLFTYATRGLQGQTGELEEGAAKALANLREFKLVTWNPACVVWDTIQSYNEARKLFSNVLVRIYHNYVDEDFVTACGKYLLGYRYKQDDPDDKPKLIKYKLRDLTTSVGTTLTTHRTPLLVDNAKGVEILPIPQDQVNYKLGPRGIGTQVYAMGAGVGKNMWRIPMATYYGLTWTVKIPYGVTAYLVSSVSGLWQRRTSQVAPQAQPAEPS